MPFHCLRRVIAAGLLLASGGCWDTGQAAGASTAGVPLHLYHGIVIGQAIAPSTFSCSDSTDRTVAGRPARQIITLANVTDFCSECDRHLAGVQAEASALARNADPFLLTYASAARRAETARMFRARTGLPVCFDTTGAFWRRYDVSHTPLTIVLRDDVVVYGSDGPLDDTLKQSQFARNAARMLAAP